MFPEVETLDRRTLLRKGGQGGFSSPASLPVRTASLAPCLLALFQTTPIWSLGDVVVGITQSHDPTP